MASKISTFAQSQQIITRFKSTQQAMDDLQRQIATGTKSDTYAGYGSDVKRLQQTKISIDVFDTYMNNIDLTQIDLSLMQNSLSETDKQLNNVLDVINLQTSKPSGEYDLAAIKNVATAALEIVKANVNQEIDGRYLFSGARPDVKPYSNASSATSSSQNLVNNWLNGTITTSQFNTSIGTMTGTQLGYDINISSASKIVARADDNFEVDYTVRGTTDGFKDAIAALNVIANLTVPDPTKSVPDVPTRDEFFDVIETLFTQLKGASEDLRTQNRFLAATASVLNEVHDQHTTDKNSMLKISDSIQNVDTAEAVTFFQSYQTQLEASFRTSSIISKLSLSNFIS